MKKLVALAVLFVSSITAQDMEVVNGDFGFLNGQKEINVEFKYDNLKLMEDI